VLGEREAAGAHARRPQVEHRLAELDDQAVLGGEAERQRPEPSRGASWVPIGPLGRVLPALAAEP
jgi:hypothetical protein